MTDKSFFPSNAKTPNDVIASWLSLEDAQALSSCATKHEKDFLYHCFFRPWYAGLISLLLNTQFKLQKDAHFPSLWMSPYIIPVVAQNRWIKELQLNGVEPSAISGSKSYLFWHIRFLEWETSLLESFKYFSFSKCGDETIFDSFDSHPIFLGMLDHFSGHPPQFSSKAIDFLHQHSTTFVRKFYSSAASLKSSRWDYPEIDSWLIQVWPIVVNYNWNYGHVLRIAAKFDRDNKPTFEDADAMSSHCKMLKLRLSDEQRKRRGRFKRKEDPLLGPLPPMAKLAKDINPYPFSWDKDIRPPYLLKRLFPKTS